MASAAPKIWSKKRSIQKINPKTKKVKAIDEIRELDKRILDEAPPCSAAKLLKLSKTPSSALEEEKPGPKLFSELPISSNTLKGLEYCKFVKMTRIQRQSIMHGLAGRDVLGAAKTGSGKTLAFVIPLIENLYRMRWDRGDALGALVISPTRELALQIFNVLRKVGRKHRMSAGLLIGGMKRGGLLEDEQRRLPSLNVIVATPGRLLQHLDESANFRCDNLKLLVLDEADRLLEAGFEKSLREILKALPIQRQTMLFSATQTRTVARLSSLSLVSPEFISPDSEAKKATPSKLRQQYIEVEAHNKFDLLLSFLKTHTESKILVFFTTRKQSKFAFEMLRKLHPGIKLSCIHGKHSQGKRLDLYEKFQKSKKACLLTTDMFSRGIDLKTLDWVISFDCPEDVKTYIHRVGRTARNNTGGCALLFLLPSESRMIRKLREAKIPIVRVCRKRPGNKKQSLECRFASFIAECDELKALAQKAFVCYVKSVAKMRDKTIFDLSKIDIDKLCSSMGLASRPVLKFSNTTISKKNKPFELENLTADEEKKKKISSVKKKKESEMKEIGEKPNLEKIEKSPKETDFFNLK